MNVTPDDIKARFKEIHVSLIDGRVLPVRVKPMLLDNVFGFVGDSPPQVAPAVASVTDQGERTAARMTHVSVLQIYQVSCALAGFDLGPATPLLESAKQFIARLAPDRTPNALN